MKELDSQHLFYDSPYPVKLDDGEYIFRTDHDIVYAVSFKRIRGTGTVSTQKRALLSAEYAVSSS